MQKKFDLQYIVKTLVNHTYSTYDVQMLLSKFINISKVSIKFDNNFKGLAAINMVTNKIYFNPVRLVQKVLDAFPFPYNDGDMIDDNAYYRLMDKYRDYCSTYRNFCALHELGHYLYTDSIKNSNAYKAELCPDVPSFLVDYVINVVEDSVIQKKFCMDFNSTNIIKTFKLGIRITQGAIPVNDFSNIVSQVEAANVTNFELNIKQKLFWFIMKVYNEYDKNVQSMWNHPEYFAWSQETLNAFDNAIRITDTKLRCRYTVGTLSPLIFKDLLELVNKAGSKATSVGDLLDQPKLYQSTQTEESEENDDTDNQDDVSSSIDESDETSKSSSDSSKEDDSSEEESDDSNGSSSNSEDGEDSSDEAEESDEESEDEDSDEDETEDETEDESEEEAEDEDDDLDDDTDESEEDAKDDTEADDDEEKSDDDLDEEEEDSEVEDEDDDESEESEDDSNDEDDDSDSDSDESDETSDEDNDSSDSDSDSSGGDGAGAPSPDDNEDNNSLTEEELNDLLQKTLNDITDDFNSESDYDDNLSLDEDKINSINTNVRYDVSTYFNPSISKSKLSDLVVDTYNEAASVLQRLYTQADVVVRGLEQGELDEEAIVDYFVDKSLNIYKEEYPAPVGKDILAYFLLDVSGSMRGDKLILAQQAFEGLMYAFNAVHIQTCLLTFSDDTSLVKPFDLDVPFSNPSELSSAFKMISAGGGTGIMESLNFILKDYYFNDVKYHKIVIIATDGEVDYLDPEIAQAIADNSLLFVLGLDFSAYQWEDIKDIIVKSYSIDEIVTQLPADIYEEVAKKFFM